MGNSKKCLIEKNAVSLMAKAYLHITQIRALYCDRTFVGLLLWCLGDQTVMHCSGKYPKLTGPYVSEVVTLKIHVHINIFFSIKIDLCSQQK